MECGVWSCGVGWRRRNEKRVVEDADPYKPCSKRRRRAGCEAPALYVEQNLTRRALRDPPYDGCGIENAGGRRPPLRQVRIMIARAAESSAPTEGAVVFSINPNSVVSW